MGRPWHSADCAVVRYLPVHPSHAGILSHTHVVFRTKRHGTTPTGIPPPQTGALNSWGVKNCYFRPISRFISEMIQDRAIVAMECEQTFKWYHFNDLEQSLTQISRSRPRWISQKSTRYIHLLWNSALTYALFEGVISNDREWSWVT